MRRLLTLDEVAALLQVPKKTLYSQRSRGEEPGALGFKVGAHVRFDPDELEAHIEARKREARSRRTAVPSTSAPPAGVADASDAHRSAARRRTR